MGTTSNWVGAFGRALRPHGRTVGIQRRLSLAANAVIASVTILSGLFVGIPVGSAATDSVGSGLAARQVMATPTPNIAAPTPSISATIPVATVPAATPLTTVPEATPLVTVVPTVSGQRPSGGVAGPTPILTVVSSTPVAVTRSASAEVIDAISSAASVGKLAVANGAFSARATDRRLAVGVGHTCALRADNQALCWGSNYAGALGNGGDSGSNGALPTRVSGGAAYRTISAGDNHSCGITSDNDLLCWGWNTHGQVGDGTTTDRSKPVSVVTPPNVTFDGISLGEDRACAVSTVGSVYCWGYGGLGGIGNGSTSTVYLPTTVNTPNNIIFVDIVSGAWHSCALSNAGQAWCWGSNASGQLGNGRVGDTSTFRTTPVAVLAPGGVTFSSIAAGKEHTCGLTPTGIAYCWGANGSGQLGNGSALAAKTTPVAVLVPNGVSFTSLAAGGDNTCANTQNGFVYCWGLNAHGELGNGTTSDFSSSPIAVSMPSGVTAAAVATGGWANFSHSCFVTTGSIVYCWGLGAGGMLGNGAFDDQHSPIRVAGPTIIDVTIERRLGDGSITYGKRIGIAPSTDRTRTLKVIGTNFTDGSTVVVSGGGISVGNVTRVDASNLSVSVVIGRDAVPTSRNLSVTLVDGASATLANAFEVVAPPSSVRLSPGSILPGATGVPATISAVGLASDARVRVAPNSGDVIIASESKTAQGMSLTLNTASTARVGGERRTLYVDNLDESPEVAATPDLVIESGRSSTDPVLLQSGWNMVSLTALPSYVVTASIVCRTIDAAGTAGTIVEVVQWANGGWVSHRCGYSPNDFTVELGRGILVNLAKAGTWKSPT